MQVTEEDHIRIKTLEVRPIGFLNFSDRNFLKHYTMDHLFELLDRERVNQFPQHFEYGPEFDFFYGTSKMRAYVVNKLFGVASTPELKMTDKSIVFQAVSIMD